MKRIKSVDVFAAAKVGAAIFGCLAVVFVPLGFLLGQTGVAVPGHLDPAAGLLGSAAWHIGRTATWIVVAAIYVLGYALEGLITGALAAFVYNYVAKRFGGIEVEVEEAPALLGAKSASSV